MSKHIEPTLGRIVWYRGKDNISRAAIVTHVWSQFLINLQAFGKDLNDTEAGIHTSVTHGDIEDEPRCYPSWSWMPYQKGQAAKNEPVNGNATQAVAASTDNCGSDQDTRMEAEIKDLGLNAPRVTKEQIDELMSKVTCSTYVVEDTTTTIAVAMLAVGESNFTLAMERTACIDKRNFNAELGAKYAIENAMAAARSKLWELEGYALAKQLATESLSPHNTINS